MVGMPNSDALCGRQTVLRRSIKSTHRAGPEAGAPGIDAGLSSSVKADSGPVQSVDTKQGSDRGICPAFRFLAFNVGRSMFDVWFFHEYPGYPVNPVHPVRPFAAIFVSFVYFVVLIPSATPLG
jgi:hypothetical protein